MFLPMSAFGGKVSATRVVRIHYFTTATTDLHTNGPDTRSWSKTSLLFSHLVVRNRSEYLST